MKMKRYIFVGNRRFVLEQMLENKVNLVGVAIIEGSHLERDMQKGAIDLPNTIVIHSKQEVIDFIKNNDFDVLISNGCSYILPINELPKACYVNIHPSYLPDLKGIDPAIGAILYKRHAGATCHIMDAGIDTGRIISQVKIPYTDDLDVTLLYQMSFHAEKQVFLEALTRDFEAYKDQDNIENPIYYSRKTEDMEITFSESNEDIIQKIKAFNNLSIGCKFYVDGDEYRVYNGEKMYNSYLQDIVFAVPEGIIAFSYEGNIIFHKDGQIFKLGGIKNKNNKTLCAGKRLFALSLL